jgi:hypothetical protein
MRDRLIELLNKQRNGKKKVVLSYGEFADFLLANGVIVQAHGHWIEQSDGWDGVLYTCSACRCDWCTIDGTPVENNMRYCPECGARMDESMERSNENGE